MHNPDEWRIRGVHWHSYVETRDGKEFLESISTRSERLARSPDAVLCSPDEVADWISTITSRHARRALVRLLGPRGGIGHIGDAGHLEHDVLVNLDVLERGDSLYSDVARETDRLHLYVEAVTGEECAEGHDTPGAARCSGVSRCPGGGR